MSHIRKSSTKREVSYIVEEILAQRVRNGQNEYFVKWKGFGKIHNTWEPEGNFHPYLIEQYEKNQTVNYDEDDDGDDADSSPKRVNDNVWSSQEENQDPLDANIGFNRGLIPERILGATHASKEKGGKLQFLMKWKHANEADLVWAKTANIRCPQVVIQFYEKQLEWKIEED
jgi:chromobox protein 1